MRSGFYLSVVTPIIQGCQVLNLRMSEISDFMDLLTCRSVII